MTMIGMLNTMSNMMQKFMQDQQPADPIPNMQYLAPGGAKVGATQLQQEPMHLQQEPSHLQQEPSYLQQEPSRQRRPSKQCSWR